MMWGRSNRRITQTIPWRMRVLRAVQWCRAHRALLWRRGRWVGIALLVLVMWCVALPWGSYLSMFSVTRIDVRGVSRIAPDEAMQFAGIEEHMSMWRVDVDDMAQRLRRHPWVHRVLVRRIWPHEVRVDIEEYVPAILLGLGDVYMADASGHVFRRLTSRDALDLPVLTGLNRDVVENNRGKTAEVIHEALLLVEDARATGHGKVDEVHWDEYLGWSVILVHDDYPRGMRVNLGRDPARRLPGLDVVLDDLRKAGRTPETVWLDGVKHPKKVQVKVAAF